MEIDRLSTLRLKAPLEFFPIVPPARFEMLTDPRCELEPRESSSGTATQSVAGANDDTICHQGLHRWVKRIEKLLLARKEAGDLPYLVCVATLEDAFGAVYCDRLNVRLAAHFNPAFEERGDITPENARDFAYETACTRAGRKVKEVHVLVAVCPQFPELKRAAQQCPQYEPCAEVADWEFFSADEFCTLRKLVDRDFHGGDPSTTQAVFQP